jgi:hypothetical protein
MVTHGISRSLTATLSAYSERSALARHPERLGFDARQLGNRNHSLSVLEEIDRRKGTMAGRPKTDPRVALEPIQLLLECQEVSDRIQILKAYQSHKKTSFE